MAEFLQLMENWDGQVLLGTTPVNEAAVARVAGALQA